MSFPFRGSRRDRGDRGSRSYGGRGYSNRPTRDCFDFRNKGHCKFGDQCKFSHANGTNGTTLKRTIKPEETLEQEFSRTAYNAWKRLIKTDPRTRGDDEILHLWVGALAILNDDDQEWKQQLPRDLDDERYLGREHIRWLMGKEVQGAEHGPFIKVSRAFLQTMTHAALLDCLSVDTYVGALYNFIGGTNGRRAVPYFQRLCEVLGYAYTENLNSVPVATIETTLLAMSTALRELLRREQRVRFNDELMDLVDSVDNLTSMIGAKHESITCQIVGNQIAELRAMVARAGGLLFEEEQVEGNAIRRSSSYPRDIVIPRDRHDNDKMDITNIKIFPTRDEILSDVIEFLPSTDRDQPHFLTDQVARHIDTFFRLLRHETFGEMKQALSNLMSSIQEDPSTMHHPKLTFGDVRANHYTGAYVNYVTFSRQRGLEVHLTFVQPYAVRKKTALETRKWWEDSKRLEEGNLLSLISGTGTEMQHLFLTVLEKTASNGKAKHGNQATVTAKLAMHDQSILESMINTSCRNIKGVLVEFPKVLPATFVPILENLQRMQRLGRLPFRQWILPDRTDHATHASLHIPLPVYARNPTFSFPLTSILVNGGDNINIDSSSSSQDEILVGRVEASTTLDHGQSRALIAALTREFAFIQGPPGTGKSYLGIQLMRVLMSIKTTAHLGPIVVVCYTNHALDQFLEHLLAVGITKIIRMGGQSHSSLLEEHNLRTVVKTESKTRSESWQIAKSYEMLEIQEKQINMRLGRLHGMHKNNNWKYYQRHLASRYPIICQQFAQTDEEGFHTAGRHPFDIWISKAGMDVANVGSENQNMTRILQQANVNVHLLSQHERRLLVEHWTKELHEATADELFELIKEAESTERSKQMIYDEVDRRVLQGADVIGITTTGLAKRIATLQRVRCKVIICEEAGEVLEPHMLSALLPTVEHFIQIGDHEQLRPSINNFTALSVESKQGALYQLDRSQFERLSVGERGRPKVPVAQLNVQRRMRPQISTLIRETIYPSLVDHESTRRLPNVVGMRQNVYWLDHGNVEEGEDTEGHNDKSKSNLWEVEMVHALVRHIVRQGAYKSSEIAVLTPYTGQLQKLRKAMGTDFEIVLSDRDQDALAKDGFVAEMMPVDEAETIVESGSNRRKPLEKKKLSDLLRVATVDNFQGEEAKIVIISLVRSNKNQKVGFLKTTNRINVLLSRAQHGMFLIGNTDTYCNVPMWQKVIGMLRASDAIGKSFGLCCPRHPETEIIAEQPDDFARNSPEGGCRLACDRRRTDCGHRCEARCHSESMHEVFSCPKPCERLHQPCGHSCQKATCGEECGNCQIMMYDVQLPCGHIKDNVMCYMTQDLDIVSCNTIVRKSITECSHFVEVKCLLDVNTEHYKCPTPCGTLLPCGHPCPGTCGRCNNKDDNGVLVIKHQRYQKTCGRRFGTCNHTCPRTCHDGNSCGPCFASCEVRCAHSKCPLRCHEPCAPCIEPCTWKCEHQNDCTLPCSAPCNRLPCEKRCSKILPCNHQCPGVCGEVCPTQYCHACETHQDDRVDMLEFKTYSEIDVNEKPIVVLACGHFFTAETLDGMIYMTEVYETDQLGNIVAIKDISASFATSIPKCPDCSLPIRQFVTQRFNRVINRAVIDEMSKRFLVSGQTELANLKQRVREIEEVFEASQQDILAPLKTSRPSFDNSDNIKAVPRKVQHRYESSKQLEKDIRQFQRDFADKHQPSHKLHEATVNCWKRTATLDASFAALNVSESTRPVDRDRRITLGGGMLQIEIESLVLEDKFSILKAAGPAFSVKFPGGSPLHLTRPFLQGCEKFIHDCNQENLPKLAVEATLHHARIVRAFASSGLLDAKEREKATACREEAKRLLEQAKELCTQRFKNADILGTAIEGSLEVLGREWYEAVSAEELAAIKQAMVSGHGGIATHSRHWYNCVNGHPFAIGECGEPMELARCPECGERIGGQRHQAAEGVTRAFDMEA